MIKKTMILFAAAVIIAGLSACSSVQTGTTLNNMKLATGETEIAHLNGNIWGIYLFNVLPLFSGSYTSTGTCAVFRDTVATDHAVSMLTRHAANLGASKVLNLQTSRVAIPFLFVIAYKEIDVTGNAVK